MSQTPPANSNPGGATLPSTTPPATPPPASATPATWDEWLAQQTEDQRKTITGLFDKRMEGVTSALSKERDDRKALEKQVRDLGKAAESGSDLQKQLTGIADQLATAERRADFYEAAAKPEVGLVDVKAAWLIANAEPDAYFDKRGNLNVELLKKEHPSLFAQPKPTPKANTGNGTRNADAVAMDMNTAIRRAAGRS